MPNALQEVPVVEEDPVTKHQPSRVLRYLTLAVAALLLLGLGWTAAILTTGRTPSDTSVEAGFARDMSRHHAQAVEMAMVAYAKGADPAVRQVGYDMALTQQAQIGQMQRWLQEWELLPTGSRPAMAWMSDGAQVGPDGLMPGMATREQIIELHEARGSDVDRIFLELMIMHHLGGIHMADAALAASDRPEVIKMAEAMKRLQQQEVTEMRQLQQATQ
ncbi:DUF305 domain-containing protein [Micromonospora sp. NPDC048170]|uniref:DUF305 domain-containing protein n=1 Tax=Micromonospora sp. NPDC048170 TaxID=3154819 RepID=UPI0033C365D7